MWRWLASDAIRPWRHRSWLFPRDPEFAMKAGLILDLYGGIWQGEPLTSEDYVLSADEKTSIQTRRRRHAPLSPAPDHVAKIEHEYVRMGAFRIHLSKDVHETGSSPTVTEDGTATPRVTADYYDCGGSPALRRQLRILLDFMGSIPFVRIAA